MTTSIRLPDFQAISPWKTAFNPHYAEAAAASSAWVLGFDVFSGSASQEKLDIFERTGGALLAAYSHPTADVEELRTACDFINLLYSIDELTDGQSAVETNKTAQTIIRSFQDDKYDDGTPLCSMSKSFMQRLQPFSGTDSLARFVEHVASYVRAVVTEVEHREQNVVLDVAAYDALRRENSAVRCCLALIGCALGMDLPDVAFEDPAFQRMHFAAVDMISWSNDVYSYRREQAMGQITNNVLTVLRRNSNMSLQESIDYTGIHYRELYETFETSKTQLASYGAQLDFVIAEHIKAMEYWFSGNLEWSLATLRYFGKESTRVRETLHVRMSA